MTGWIEDGVFRLLKKVSIVIVLRSYPPARVLGRLNVDCVPIEGLSHIHPSLRPGANKMIMVFKGCGNDQDSPMNMRAQKSQQSQCPNNSHFIWSRQTGV